jgi:hypothetical protein
MMLAKARIIALVIGAGLVGPVSFANAQMAAVEQKLMAFKQTSVGTPGHTSPSPVLTVLANTGATLTPGLVQNAARGVPGATGIMQQKAQLVQEAVDRRNAAANELGGAIEAAMKTMNPNNQQDMKRLDEVFGEIQAINKTTNDALLGYYDTLALLKEQAASGAPTQ